jgi:hypothetical protein
MCLSGAGAKELRTISWENALARVNGGTHKGLPVFLAPAGFAVA